MTEHNIWVICATRGEHSDREFWVVCWAMTEDDAQGLAETLTNEQEKFQTPWKRWLAENGRHTPAPGSAAGYKARKKLTYQELSAGMLVTPSMYDEIEFTVEKVSDVPARQ